MKIVLKLQFVNFLKSNLSEQNVSLGETSTKSQIRGIATLTSTWTRVTLLISDTKVIL